MLKPIPEGTFFVDSNNKVFIFTEAEPEEIIFKDKDDESAQIIDFFKLNEELYITRMVEENTGTEEEPTFESVLYHYKQSSGKITEIPELPSAPVQNYTNFISKNWIIKKTVFGDGFVSDIKNLLFKGGARFRQVFGCFEIETGLFFNVLDSGKPGLQEGLYFFPVERTSCSRIKEKGVIW